MYKEPTILLHVYLLVQLSRIKGNAFYNVSNKLVINYAH